jgi:hypothetical protein
MTPNVTICPPAAARGSESQMPKSRARKTKNNYGRLCRAIDNTRPGDVLSLMGGLLFDNAKVAGASN